MSKVLTTLLAAMTDGTLRCGSLGHVRYCWYSSRLRLCFSFAHQAPNIPSISSETSSAVSDRGVYTSNSTAGYVSGYDVNYPSWGQSAEQAWGGIGETNGQGILTRAFISGGWTWTGHDYRGEPTPDGWPDVNSHFGIVDAAGFPKDRFYWYQAWFMPRTPMVYLFPHWK